MHHFIMLIRTLFLVTAAVFLSANVRPRYTPAQMAQRATLVAAVRVTAPEHAVGDHVCIEGDVLRVTKGHANGRIFICSNGISELTPPKPTKGNVYTMYLRGAEDFYFPVSSDAFQRLN
jgi:hypothetical protein